MAATINWYCEDQYGNKLTSKEVPFYIRCAYTTSAKQSNYYESISGSVTFSPYPVHATYPYFYICSCNLYLVPNGVDQTKWTSPKVVVKQTSITGTVTKKEVAQWGGDSFWSQSQGTSVTTVSGTATVVLQFTRPYTATFDKNGGSGTDVSPIEGVTISLPSPSDWTKNGYTFNGWNTDNQGSGTHYDVGSSVTLSQNTTFYAEWSAVTYTITVDPNGGTGGSANPSTYQISSSPQSIALTSPTPPSESQYLSSWSATAGTISEDNQTLTIPANTVGNISVVANWSYGVIVSFSPNGGNDPSFWFRMFFPNISTWTFPSVARTGYDLVGWFTESSGGAQKTAGSIVDVNIDTTLYAHWSDTRVTITYSAGNGFVNPSSEMKTPGGQYGTLPTPVGSNPNDVFLGWYTEEAGGTQITSSSIVPEESTTIYAHWNAHGYSVTVIFDAVNGTSSEPSRTVESGQQIGALPYATKQGYIFVGWVVSTNDSNVITSSYIVPANGVTLYARYAPSSITVTFDANGGSSSEVSRSIYYGSEVGTLPYASKSDGLFAGWFDESVTPNIEVSSHTVFFADCTVVAHWSAYSPHNILTMEYIT